MTLVQFYFHCYCLEQTTTMFSAPMYVGLVGKKFDAEGTLEINTKKKRINSTFYGIFLSFTYKKKKVI